MKIIYKYPLQVASTQLINMPADAQLLDVQMQDNIACLWVLVSPENYAENRIIHIIPTGDLIPDFVWNGKYIATIQPRNGLVFHVFDGGRK